MMDAVAEWDADTSKVHLNTNSVVITSSDGFAHIMKGIAPLPGRPVGCGARDPARGEGSRLAGRWNGASVRLPLHGRTLTTLTLQLQYRQREIAGIVLTIHPCPRRWWGLPLCQPMSRRACSA